MSSTVGARPHWCMPLFGLILAGPAMVGSQWDKVSDTEVKLMLPC